MPDDRVERSDPAAVETLVVHAEDVVTAYEARARSGERSVLRATPPFSARMRAHIHVHRPGEYEGQAGPRPIHVPPGDLLAEDCPAYPEPDETAREVGDADPETHYEHHREAVAQWRERACDHLRERIGVDHEGRTLHLSVDVLRRSGLE